MGHHITLNLGCQNPAGIDINEGYYALLLSIIKDISPDESIYHITGKRPEYRRSKIEKKNGNLKEKILAIYRNNEQLKFGEIAKIAGCTPQYVTVTLKDIPRIKTKKPRKTKVYKKDIVNKVIKEHPDWTIKEISEQTGISYVTVSQYYNKFYSIKMASLFE